MAPCMFLGIRCRMSRMKMRNRVGDSTPPCGMPCLRVLFLLRCCFNWTFAFLLCIYCPVHLNILPATPHWYSFNFRPSFHTLSNAFSRSIHTASVCFLSWKASSIAWAIWVIWSSVDRSCLKVACSGVICFFSSRCHTSLVLMRRSISFPTQLVRLIGR